MALSGTIGEHYEIVELLGRGAMGEVYRAIDRKMFDRPVAIKVLTEKLTDSEEGRARFRREIETAARLNHPNIVTIYAWGEHERRDYFVMELIEGRDLQGLLREGVDWSLEQRLQLGAEIADALAAAHARGVVHRDIKPANVMVTTANGEPKVKLVDFGIAHVERSGLTNTEHQPGTYAYMSPEQLRGQAVDLRSDLFSFGIVLCEIFSGHHPFEAPSEAMISSRVLRDEPDPPSLHPGDVPRELERLLLRLLSKESEERPDSAVEVARSLRELARGGGQGGDDELERQLLGGLTRWAGEKEAEESWEDALAAYERVLPLASDRAQVQRKIEELQSKVFRRQEQAALVREIEQQLDQGRLADARAALSSAELTESDPRRIAIEKRMDEFATQDSGDRERTDFVAERMRGVDDALERGEVEQARGQLTEVLRRYPDEASAATMLSRLLDIARGGIDYKAYRSELQRSRRELELGELEAARQAIEQARTLWPEGPELDELQARIARAEEATERRAQQAREVKQREAEERARRERELLEQYVGGARELLGDARASLRESPQEPQRAVRALEKTVEALDLVLAERPDHTEAGALRDDVLAEIESLRKQPPPPPPVERRSEPAPAPAPRRLPLVAAAVVAVLVIAVGAVWIVSQRGGAEEPDGRATELARILALGESSLDEVELKLTQVNAIDALPGLEAERKDALVAERVRLETLIGMYSNLGRIEQARDDGDRQAAEMIREFLSEARSQLAPDDATANRLADRADQLVESIPVSP